MDATSEDRIEDQERRRLRDHAARIRASEALGRSRALNDLFDFLLRCSLEERSPKEIEVRHEVFGRGADLDQAQDASVRVYVHRLRRKLEEYHAAHGIGDGRLYIPRGEYRLRVADPAEPETEPSTEAEPEDEPVPARRRPSRRTWLALGLLLLLALNAAAWAAFVGLRDASDPVVAARKSALWRPLTAGARPTVVVVGDYYIFGESDSRVEISRLVREFGINSRDDLDEYLMANPEQMGRYVDLDLSYLPVGSAVALGDLVPVLKRRASDAPVRVMPLSELTPQILSASNLVYVGLFSGLGMLRDPLFAASRLSIGANYDELVDKRTGRHFVADWANRVGGMPSSRDYGYVASVIGPSGNHIVVIAGTRDTGLMQAARSAADPAVLGRLDQLATKGKGFEALFAVESMGNTNLAGKLLLSGPLDPAAVWQSGGQREELPMPDHSPPATAR